MQENSINDFFYDRRDEITRYSARTVLPLVLDHFGDFRSVLDIGCGVGTWLAVAEELGATTIQGVEALWISSVPSLVIPRSKIKVQDLEDLWQIVGEFDLGICLEVAEHLSEASGVRLVSNLARHCRVVLFSAAIPGQGGNGHINEQLPSYWQNLFIKHGMDGIDLVRPHIWNDTSIPWWYRQNIFLFAHRSVVQEYYQRLANDPEYRFLPLMPISITTNTACQPNSQRNSLLQLIFKKMKVKKWNLTNLIK